MICTGVPDLRRIHAALEAINRGLSQAGSDSIRRTNIASAEAQKHLRDWFQGLAGLVGQTTLDSYLNELENASTDHLSDSHLHAIGPRRVTALTVGVPYGFVRRREFAWKDKAIGHLVGDKNLMLLTELYVEGIELKYASINLVFDPGYFRTLETANVAKELHEHYSHSIIAQGIRRA